MVKLLDEMSPHTGSVLPESHLTRFVLPRWAQSAKPRWVPNAIPGPGSSQFVEAPRRRMVISSQGVFLRPRPYSLFHYFLMLQIKKPKIWNVHLKRHFEACVKLDHKEGTAYSE